MGSEKMVCGRVYEKQPNWEGKGNLGCTKFKEGL